MGKLQIIDDGMLDDVSAQARAAPRLRRNRNIHASEQEPCNRLLNALEPGTYFVPHLHEDSTKDETMVMLRGSVGLLVFDRDGNVVEKAILDAAGGNRAVTIPHGVWHSIVVLEPGTILFETKAGPYRPFKPHELAPWAPKEGTPEAPAYLAKLRQEFA